MTDLMDKQETKMLKETDASESIAEIAAELAAMFFIPERQVKDIVNQAIKYTLDYDLTQTKHPKAPRYGKAQAAAVRYAANHLDKIKPGWECKIHPWAIILIHEGRCILGQIFGDYNYGLSVYCKSASTMPGGVHVFVGNGFMDRHFIKKAWRREIKSRR